MGEKLKFKFGRRNVQPPADPFAHLEKAKESEAQSMLWEQYFDDRLKWYSDAVLPLWDQTVTRLRAIDPSIVGEAYNARSEELHGVFCGVTLKWKTPTGHNELRLFVANAIDIGERFAIVDASIAKPKVDIQLRAASDEAPSNLPTEMDNRAEYSAIESALLEFFRNNVTYRDGHVVIQEIHEPAGQRS